MGIGEDYQKMRFDDVCDVTTNVSEVNVGEKIVGPPPLKQPSKQIWLAYYKGSEFLNR